MGWLRRLWTGLRALWDAIGTFDDVPPGYGRDDPADIVMCGYGEDETVWIPMDVLNEPLADLRTYLARAEGGEALIDLRAQLARVEDAIRQARRN